MLCTALPKGLLTAIQETQVACCTACRRGPPVCCRRSSPPASGRCAFFLIVALLLCSYRLRCSVSRTNQQHAICSAPSGGAAAKFGVHQKCQTQQTSEINIVSTAGAPDLLLHRRRGRGQVLANPKGRQGPAGVELLSLLRRQAGSWSCKVFLPEAACRSCRPCHMCCRVCSRYRGVAACTRGWPCSQRRAAAEW